MKILLCKDKNDNIVERYESINDVIERNEGENYNYQSLANCIYKGIPYKGFLYEWIDTNDNNYKDSLRGEMIRLKKILEAIGIWNKDENQETVNCIQQTPKYG